MADWHFWVPTGISLAAVAFSAASWWHNLSAHSERRFGDIAKLRSDILQRLTRVEERLRDAGQGLSSVRFYLRQLPELDENKYDWIEEAPARDAETDEYKGKALKLRLSLEKLPADENSSRVLRALQLSEHEIGVLEQVADKLAQVAKEQIEAVNQFKKQERTERDARFKELTDLARDGGLKTPNSPKT
jgi:hypothetical protein